MHLIGLTLAVLLCALAGSGTAQFVYPNDEKCKTPNGAVGSCISLKSCPALLSLLTQNPLTQNAVDYLRKSQCGFETTMPKVCCPNNAARPNQPVDDTRPPNVNNHPNLRLIENQNCGPINADKIVGGNLTGVFEIPWMALLAYDTGRPKPEFRCGGSIINKRWILTAAHCVTNLSGLRLVGVRVGEHDISKERDCDAEGTPEEVCAEKYQDFGIESVKYHEQYSSSSLHNDVALIRVDRNIDFRPDNVKPICLPFGSAAGTRLNKLMVTGWGVTEQHISSDVLLKVKLSVYPQDECAKTYSRQTQIWHKQICIGGDRGHDSCSGDSGGPLVAPAQHTGTSRYVQFGIVSFGVKQCGLHGFPGVYTRVDYYLDWILNNMRD